MKKLWIILIFLISLFSCPELWAKKIVHHKIIHKASVVKTSIKKQTSSLCCSNNIYPNPTSNTVLAKDPPVIPVASNITKSNPITNPEIESTNFIINNNDIPILTPEGLGLIVEYEVGGEAQYKKWPHPEYSGEGSGVTWGIGYDAHQNKKSIILLDWTRIGESFAQRLANTQPYYGNSAKEHLKDVKDISVLWDPSIAVFTETDVSRTETECRRAFPGFDELRSHAKDAIISLVFNRGPSMAGPNRTEMRTIRDAVPEKDYQTMANAEIKMIRVWNGTSIYAGMARRRRAEAKLFLTP